MATSRRRKASSGPGHAKPSKRLATKPETAAAPATSTKNFHVIYNECILQEDDEKRWDAIRGWDERGAVTEVILPLLSSNKDSTDSDEFAKGCQLLVVLISRRHWEGSFGSSPLEFQDEEVVDDVVDFLLYKSDHEDYQLQTQVVHFLVIVFNSDSEFLVNKIIDHASGIGLMHHISTRRCELELKRSAGLRRKFQASRKRPVWLASNVQLVLELIEGKSERIGLFSQTPSIDSEEVESTEDLRPKWNFVHRSLELIIDLLSGPKTRFFVAMFLDSMHFTVRSRHAMASSSAHPKTDGRRLLQHLLRRVQRLLTFPIREAVQKDLSKVDVVSMHHERANTLQKMAYRHFRDELQQLVYAGLGLLCTSTGKNSYLEKCLIGLPDDKFASILYKLRLVGSEETEPERDFLLQILSNHLSIPPYPMDQLKASPLYPTEKLLWDHNIIPPSIGQLRESDVLSLPKLNSRFLSFQDYLLRNFELVRLESAYDIRSDIVHVVRRVRPLLEQVGLDEEISRISKTRFGGWSRMALELVKPLEMIEVQPPRLGETVSAKVVAEITIDLEPCGLSLRQEWDQIGVHDNLFLVAIDASKMTGEPAPTFDSRGPSRISLHKNGTVPDEDDCTFPQRFGITSVRGCMVLQVLDGEGNVQNETGGRNGEGIRRKGTKRIYRVAMDTSQYARDLESKDVDYYKTFNLVVRRHGRENNFRSVLETIRGLMEGIGSISRVIPPWLQNIILGQGDPSSASYKSETIKSYARETVGVNKPTDFLDFGDTFLDGTHLRKSFGGKLIIDGSDFEEKKNAPDGSRVKYKLKFTTTSEEDPATVQNIEAVSVPFEDGVVGNSVPFNSLQVEAIRAGLSPGLSLVVGPPGTGKTDVAVQIIASLYHSFPTQRTVIITHSNAALNDIFTKVMSRGDVDERYLLRLGSGERDLQVDSTHDFTKMGRVEFSSYRRRELLERVQLLSESLGISGKAERGADGSPSYTCETADYFFRHQFSRRRMVFDNQVSANKYTDNQDVSQIFPFSKYFDKDTVTLGEAKKLLQTLENVFLELAEYRPLELLRSQKQKGDYLILKQARIVAMTCTHAAIARSHLLEIGFEYDNIVMEESGQMLEIESFIPFLLQTGRSDESVSGLSRLKRICMLGDHNQLPPVVKNASFSKYSNLDQSLFSRLIRLGVPYIQLNEQGRARSELRKLYSWRYDDLGDLEHIRMSRDYKTANAGFVHSCQLIDVGDFQGRGESTPTAYFYQNLGEAEYAAALFQYMLLIGYPAQRISILTTYNGQKELISDIIDQRCGVGTPFGGARPKAVSTVDQYQGQQNDIILLSLVRTKTVGHLRDVRRLVVALSRARLGLYVFCRRDLFTRCHELKKAMDQLAGSPGKLQLVTGESTPTERLLDDKIPAENIFEVEDVTHLGSVVHSMQENMMKTDD